MSIKLKHAIKISPAQRQLLLSMCDQNILEQMIEAIREEYKYVKYGVIKEKNVSTEFLVDSALYRLLNPRLTDETVGVYSTVTINPQKITVQEEND